jgi:ABC-2 type transport system ATP-binding protein
MTPALETRDLAKRYGAVEALRGLDLTVPRGGVFGLLGPNGAGKSTLLRIAIGLVCPGRGVVSLLGEPVGPRALQRVGSLIESPRFYPHLTATETLQALAATAGIFALDSDGLLARVGLAHASNQRTDGFSLGMKQRLGIATALIGAPELVILDEPTNGLDPGGIQEVRALIRSLADEDGITVLLSSHLLDEVQKVCDRVAILNGGALAAEGPIGDFLSNREELLLDVDANDRVLAMVGSRGSLSSDGVVVAVPRSEAPQLISALVAAGVSIYEARWLTRGLEQVFFEQTKDR